MQKTILAMAILMAFTGSAMAAVTVGDFKINGNEETNIDLLGGGNNETVTISAGDKDRAINAIGSDSRLVILGKDIKINVSDGNKYAKRGLVATEGASISVGNKETDKLSIITDASPTATDGTSIGVMASRGNNTSDSTAVNLSAKEIVIDAQGFGIWAQNNDESSNYPSVDTKINISADKTTINAGKVGIVAFSRSNVNIDGSLVINASEVINTRGNSIVKINEANKKVVIQLNGDINFETPGKNASSGEYISSYVTINLNGADSYWNGTAYFGYPNDQKDKPETLKVTGFTLSIADGASWTPRQVSFDPSENQGLLSIPKITLNNGVINLKDGVEAAVKELSGSGTVNLGTNGTSSGKLTVESGTGSTLDVNLMNSDLSKSLTSDDITADEAKTLLKNVGGEDSGVAVKTNVAEGMVNAAFNVDETGAVTTASANTLMQSSLELATVAPLSLNRIMMNDVRKRLGDIRTSSGTNGAWARYDGGRLSGEGGLDTDFNTIQVGFDTMPTPDSARLGLAFSYTDGDADYARGSADMKVYGLAAYGTWLGQNGQFADVIARFGKADTDMVVDGTHKGSMKNYALSLSGEFGWRFDLTKAVYVEPQVEATYTYVNSDDLTLGTAKYDVDSVDSFLTRAGLAAGLKCPNDKGNVYVRASVVHEFLGDTKISGKNGSAGSTYTMDGKDTWVEYGLGANVNLTKSTYMWADVERTSGGALDEDWRATVGVRYAW